MSGGTTTAPGGGTISPPGGGAASSATPTPSGKGTVPSAPQYVKPQASSNAQQNSFLEFLNRMSGGRPSEIRKDFEAGGTSASGSWNIRKDVSPDGRPASIRYNNPGASWTRERDELFGVEGYGIIGGGNRIGKYPTMVHGLASNMDLFSSSKNYIGKTLGEATYTWRGNRPGNVPKFQLSDGTYINEHTKITPSLLQNEEFMFNVFKQYAQHESGLKSTITDSDIREAYNMYRAGGAEETRDRCRHKL